MGVVKSYGNKFKRNSPRNVGTVVVYDVRTAMVDAVMVLRQMLRNLLFAGSGRRRIRVVGHVRLLLTHDGGRTTATLLLVVVQMALQRRSATRVTVQRSHEMREGILLLSGSRTAVGPGQVQVEQLTFCGGHYHFLVVTASRAAGAGAVLLLLLLELHGQLLLVILVKVFVGVHLLDSVKRLLLEHDVFELGMLLLLLLLVRLLLVLVEIFIFVTLLLVLMYLLLTRDQYLRKHSGHQVTATAVLGLLISLLCNQHVVTAVRRRSATVTVTVVVDTGRRRCRSRRTRVYV